MRTAEQQEKHLESFQRDLAKRSPPKERFELLEGAGQWFLFLYESASAWAPRSWCLKLKLWALTGIYCAVKAPLWENPIGWFKLNLWNFPLSVNQWYGLWLEHIFQRLQVFVMFSLMLPQYLEQSLVSCRCSVSVCQVNEFTVKNSPYFFLFTCGTSPGYLEIGFYFKSKRGGASIP